MGVPEEDEFQASPRIIYTALFLGALCATPVLVVIRLVSPMVDLPEARLALRVAAALLIVTLLILGRVLRSRIEPLPPNGDENAWWNAHLPRALTIWSVAECAALLGSVFFFLAGDALMLALIAAGFLMLLLSHPSRLMES
jgi:hypothetical protein